MTVDCRGQIGQQVRHHGRVEGQADGQVRLAGRRWMHLAHRRQLDGHDEVRRRVIAQRLVADGHRLTARQDQVDHRVVDRSQQVFRDRTLDHRHPWNTGLGAAVFSPGGEGSKFIQLIVHGDI